MEEKAIYISIKPQYTRLIESSRKDHEFRKYIPKRFINTLYVYESSPTSALKYVIKLSDIIQSPNQISDSGYGNNEFNQGIKEAKFAYKINKVYKLEHPIPLVELKEKFGFSPPQSYAYDDRYPELTEYIKTKTNLILIINIYKN